MKIATWNVNGIRARQAQVQEWLEREQPDVVCLQEIKASLDQLPVWLCEMEGYWCYWHGGEGLLGRRPARAQATLAPERPRFAHPAFDYENRIVDGAAAATSTVASVYVPNGGKDFPAKMQFLDGARAVRRRAAHRRPLPLVICGDLNVARTDMDVHPKERKPRAIGQLPGRARAARAHHRRTASSTSAARSIPTTIRLFTWWAPWREHAPAQHRLAPRLRARVTGAVRSRDGPASSSASSARAITRRSSRSSTQRKTDRDGHDAPGPVCRRRALA